MEEQVVVSALAALAQPLRLKVFRALVVAGPRGMTPGAMSEGLRVVRAQPEAPGLRLDLEGRAGRSYVLGLRTPTGFVREMWRIELAGQAGEYVRRDFVQPLVAPDGSPTGGAR